MTLLAGILILCGTFFLIISCLGLIRLPDFYTRAHATGKSDTLGVIMILGGLSLYNGWVPTTLKLIVIFVFILITAPAAIHALTHAAMVTGLQPWSRDDGATTERSVKIKDQAADGPEVKTDGMAD